MNTTTKSRVSVKGNGRGRQAHVIDAASDFLNEGKKFANEVYQEGVHRANRMADEAEENVKAYSDVLIEKVQKNPLGSVLIAAGVGFLLSSLLKK